MQRFSTNENGRNVSGFGPLIPGSVVSERLAGTTTQYYTSHKDNSNLAEPTWLAQRLLPAPLHPLAVFAPTDIHCIRLSFLYPLSLIFHLQPIEYAPCLANKAL